MLLRSLIELHQTQWLGAVDAARELGADLITYVGADLEDPHDFRAQANVIYDLATVDRLDGLIVWPMGLQVYTGTERFAEFCRRFEPLPLVSVEAVMPGHPSLLMDDRGGMAAAVSHLIEVHGHRRIAYVRGPEKHTGAQARYQGYLDALARHGLPVDPALVSTPTSFWSREEAADRVMQVLDVCGQVDAIVGSSDGHAIGAMAALEARNLRAPEDVALVGFDDDESAVHYDTVLERTGPLSDPLQHWVRLDATMLPLTTVRAPFDRLAGRAVEVLLARLRGEPVAAVEELPTELITRVSCGCFTPPAAHPERAVSAPDPRVGWADRLQAAFVDAARSPDGSDDFLAFLLEAVRSSVVAGGTLDDWWEAMLTLRSESAAQLDPEAADNAERLWVSGQKLLGEMSDRLSRYRYFVGGRREELVRGAAQRLVTTLEVAELAEALTVELPRLGIASCYLATYDDAARRWSRSLLVHEGERRRRDLEGTRFLSTRLAPPPTPLGAGQPANLVVLPLHFKERQLGFVIFEVGPRVGWIYQALQEQLAGALHAALLDAERRSAETALLLARDELEVRVTERTAQLAMSNEALTQQLVERERLEAQLRQAQRIEAIGQLAGGIAHDFNNLLVVINGYSDMLIRQVALTDSTRAVMEDIRAAGERAAALTAQLLAFSRQQVLQPTLLDVNEVVSNIETLLRRLIGEDIELTTVLDARLAPVNADRSQLEQIIVNLAVNARDAMPAGGRLLIETANVELDPDYVREAVGVKPGAYVLLKVNDTGVGMDAATQARIFEPFFTTKGPGEGTGLGLATVFGIARQSGGHVSVTSAPGRGTTFEVYLPQSAQPAVAGSPTPAAIEESAAGSETILLVEDDAAVRGATRRFLQEQGYRVLVASGGSEALRLCREDGPSIDLILTDVVMPKMNGRELVELLAQSHPHTPVLYMSGYSDSETVRLKTAEGAIHLLQKPFTAGMLVHKVRQMLDRPPVA